MGKLKIMFIVFGILLIMILVSRISFRLGQQNFEDHEINCLLVLEQHVACNKGCAYFNMSTINNGYEHCTQVCDYKYNLSFKDNGQIKDCKYQDIQDLNKGVS